MTKKNKKTWNVSLLLGAVSGATLLVSASSTTVHAQTSDCVRSETGTSEIGAEIENCGCIDPDIDPDQANLTDLENTISGCATAEFGLGPPVTTEFGLAAPVQSPPDNPGIGGTYSP